MNWKFWKKKEELTQYTPIGRLGCKRIDNWPYHAVIIVEQICMVGQRSKIKILDVAIDRDCNKTKKQILNKWGASDWVLTRTIEWESSEQQLQRELGPPPVFEMVNEPYPIKLRHITPYRFSDDGN